MTFETIKLASTSVVLAPTLAPSDISAGSSWWARFRHTQTARISPIALQVLEEDARWVANQIRDPDRCSLLIDSWGTDRVKTGIVVGSIQSGKTANMLALSSMLLDRGVGIVVLLCGTQVGLWLQTYERALEQLDQSDVETAWLRKGIRLLVPEPSDVLNEFGRTDADQYVKSHRSDINIAIREGKPILAIIPKIDVHLASFRRALEYCIQSGALDDRGEPLLMTILDDEADDSSVLDAIDSGKLTPRRIQELWTHSTRTQSTSHEKFYTCYVAYTATPQANFLQDTHNPLAPRDFAIALRTPGATGAIYPRALTFREPTGLPGYYTGGWAFYEAMLGRPEPLCISIQFPVRNSSETDDEFILRLMQEREKALGDALRSYFVGAAIRIAHSGLSLSKLYSNEPIEKEFLHSLVPSPHSMLYHPSSEMEAHFFGAREISRWSKGLPIWFADSEEKSMAVPQVDPLGLANRLVAEEPEWERWLGCFRKTAEGLSSLPMAAFPFLDTSVTWEKIRQTLLDEIFQFVTIKVLNSDSQASERPEFSPRPVQGNTSLCFPPRDLLTIFVAGNVVSRGVTIEGLATSLFLRAANEPAADTQMQMQRWFGYRGKILPLCRVFLYEDQFELFRDYHDADEAAKAQVLEKMKALNEEGQVGPVVLHGESFWATKKVNSSRLPLHPGPSPSIRLVEQENADRIEWNLMVLSDLMAWPGWKKLEAPIGKVRGLILEAEQDILKIADVLDLLSYSHHSPLPMNSAYERWGSYEAQLGLPPNSLLRGPSEPQGITAVDPKSCPYSIAAYLRLWHYLAEEPGYPGFISTEDGTSRWSMIPKVHHKKLLPKFYIGVRFGEAGKCQYLLPMEVECMTRSIPSQGLLATLWGSRGREATYLGDQFFDYHYHQTYPLPDIHGGGGWRQAGHPGLLLFHVIKDEHGKDLVTAGLSLPRGGPDHIAALRG